MTRAFLNATCCLEMILVTLFFSGLVYCSQPPSSEAGSKDRLEARKRMVETQLAARDITDPDVLDAMRQVPRHRFVPDGMQGLAYEDTPLPIGYGQTISQPYIVALMTQLVEPHESDRALEIGTGSGYQAAVLAELVDEVYTIEIVEALGEGARLTLKDLGYENTHCRIGDGYAGWPEQAPFQIVVVTAAATRIPEPLIEQLAEGGRLVMPVGSANGFQVLKLLRKKEGRIEEETVTGVRFVPLTGKILDSPE